MPSRSSSDSRLSTSNRSRTPWDAGGYSLPLTLNVKNNVPQQQAPSAFMETDNHNNNNTSPNSPKHRFSDSRSSLSSAYTTNSSSHSRISSLSTVSEYQPLGSVSAGDQHSSSACPTVVEMQQHASPFRRASGGGYEDMGSSQEDNESSMSVDRARSPSDAMLMRNRVLGGGSVRYVFLLPCVCLFVCESPLLFFCWSW